MADYRIAEIFGHGTDNDSDSAWEDREAKHCPFQDRPCTKDSKDDPLGICSLHHGDSAVSLCPKRFVENDRIFRDAAQIAFGGDVSFAPVPEIHVLRKPSGRRIGKVDYLLARVDSEEKPVDFAALEVQSSYFSGPALRPALEFYLEQRELSEAERSGENSRRPDVRSCVQKRLIPQLNLKVPVFRRWGRRFFVVVDSILFEHLPDFEEADKVNSELTWLVYPISRVESGDFRLEQPTVVHTVWDDIEEALREGEPPGPDEIFADIRRKIDSDRILHS